jgi:DNA-binding CsgD family transcriptional regulator
MDHSRLLARRVSAALTRIRDLTGVSLAFGGLVRDDGTVALERFAGPTVGALPGVELERGHGLGGKVVALTRTIAVNDYIATTHITHRYDRIIRAEGLRAMAAAPVVVARKPVAVLYGALRTTGLIGDRIQDAVTQEARALEQELAVARARAEPDPEHAELVELKDRVRTAHERLRMLAARVDDDELRAELRRAGDELAGDPPVALDAPRLTDRQLDVLSLVAGGRSNAAIGEALGLTPATVKSYMKSIMSTLGAGTRFEAVVLARRYRLLP